MTIARRPSLWVRKSDQQSSSERVSTFAEAGVSMLLKPVVVLITTAFHQVGCLNRAEGPGIGGLSGPSVSAKRRAQGRSHDPNASVNHDCPGRMHDERVEVHLGDLRVILNQGAHAKKNVFESADVRI